MRSEYGVKQKQAQLSQQLVCEGDRKHRKQADREYERMPDTKLLRRLGGGRLIADRWIGLEMKSHE